ncbi:COG5614 Bacteriophage head-tail adaptor [uncultured Caudovirales phage]|uniref:COG5614 Bacteriophage head-tail adaptor n=1 Tax=uncultured Caudovirales phage TaxID=2100421 RepID=A0A6J5N0S8_9CAUD|nr:COG5614 Bacteriophage head-tail adaptor [uncultured Caudovirales phage]
MRAGKLDRRVQLQARSITRNAQNEAVESFATYATVWAEKFDLSGREYFTSNQLYGEVTTRFRIRYRTDVQMTDRIVFDSLTFLIKSIAETGRKEGLEILADAERG